MQILLQKKKRLHHEGRLDTWFCLKSPQNYQKKKKNNKLKFLILSKKSSTRHSVSNKKIMWMLEGILSLPSHLAIVMFFSKIHH